jgi:hypothetical protein
MNRVLLTTILVLAFAPAAAATPAGAVAPSRPSPPALLAAGLQGGSGSTIGPGGALYVTEMHAGRISRVDRETGEITTFASGLPPALFHYGGAVDVAFIGSTAYVLVALVGPIFGGGSDAVGIYRVDGSTRFTLVADIGVFSMNSLPPFNPEKLFSPVGNQYALEAYRGGFLVTDANHNRVLRVTLDGEITELIGWANDVPPGFGDVVPTGLEVAGNRVYVAQLGPVPHLPQDGKVIAFEFRSRTATDVASGARMVIDIERGRGRTLLAISHGDPSGPEFFPGIPNTGDLLQVADDGTFSVLLEDALSQPTSLEVVGNTAYVVTLSGEIWRIDDVVEPPYGPPLRTTGPRRESVPVGDHVGGWRGEFVLPPWLTYHGRSLAGWQREYFEWASLIPTDGPQPHPGLTDGEVDCS